MEISPTLPDQSTFELNISSTCTLSRSAGARGGSSGSWAGGTARLTALRLAAPCRAKSCASGWPACDGELRRNQRCLHPARLGPQLLARWRAALQKRRSRAGTTGRAAGGAARGASPTGAAGRPTAGPLAGCVAEAAEPSGHSRQDSGGSSMRCRSSAGQGGEACVAEAAQGSGGAACVAEAEQPRREAVTLQYCNCACLRLRHTVYCLIILLWETTTG